MASLPGRSWYHPVAFMRSVALRPRLYVATLIGVVALFLLPRSWSVMTRGAIAFDLAGSTYLFFGFRLMSACGATRIKARAARRDDSRLAILTLILFAIVASFAAIAGLIVQAKQPDIEPSIKLFLAILAVGTLMVAWTVTQVTFTFHYAHDYYSPDPGSDAGYGLSFPGNEDPDYWDFLYFAMSIGAASQTSDVEIKSRALRRLVTLHAAVAFFFNTAVLALTVNIAASLAG